MLTQTHWKETFEFEPWNPLQLAQVHYTGLPGGYSTFYYNQVPNVTGLLNGPTLPKLMDPEGGETLTVVPPVFGAVEDAKTYAIGALITVALVGFMLGAGTGFALSLLGKR